MADTHNHCPSLVIGYFLVSTLVACASEEGERLKFEISQGVNGFSGAIRPIERPVEIKIGPVRNWKAIGRSFRHNSDGSKNFASFTVSGEVAKADEVYFQVFQVDELVQNGRRWRPDKPILRVEYWIRSDGKLIGSPSIKFPAFSDAELLKEKDKLDNFRNIFLFEAKMRPKFGSYYQGDEIISNKDIEDVFKEIIPEVEVDRNSISLRALGIARVLGRASLVGKMSGSADLIGANGQLSVSIRGHWVFDKETGLSLSGMRQTLATGIVGGTPVKEEEILSFTTLDAEFLVAPKVSTSEVGGRRVITTEAPTLGYKEYSRSPSRASRSEMEKRPIAIRWEGIDELIAGSISLRRRRGGGEMSITLPNNKGTCQGTYQVSPDRSGTWSVACTNNLAASGTLTAFGSGKGSSGKGTDSRGRRVHFTVGGREP